MEQKKVLVIEDSPYLAESLFDMLELHDYQPLSARNGRDGISLALSEKPDLILLDIRLPDIDGYTVYNEIRSDKSWGANATIVVLTASESVGNIAKNIDLSSEYVLFKPEWSIQSLIEYIDSLLATTR